MAAIDADAVALIDKSQGPRAERRRGLDDGGVRSVREVLLRLDDPHTRDSAQNQKAGTDQSRLRKGTIIQ
jgi:hypothetical protein